MAADSVAHSMKPSGRLSRIGQLVGWTIVLGITAFLLFTIGQIALKSRSTGANSALEVVIAQSSGIIGSGDKLGTALPIQRQRQYNGHGTVHLMY